MIGEGLAFFAGFFFFLGGQRRNTTHPSYFIYSQNSQYSCTELNAYFSVVPHTGYISLCSSKKQIWLYHSLTFPSVTPHYSQVEVQTWLARVFRVSLPLDFQFL